MKKIIGGRKYDTTTATKVGEYEDGLKSDYRYFSETLYRKRGGEYFLHGYGHGRSRYATQLGDGYWGTGERIIPLSYEDARKWAEEHLDADDYESEFGAVGEDEGESVVLSVRVSPAAKSALDRVAARTGRSKGDIVTEALLAL